MIEGLLKNKNAKEKADIKSKEIAKVDFRGEYTSQEYGIKIDIQSIKAIKGGVEVLARAWKGDKQLGFGKDGSVEIERFKIYNPPILVDDPNGDIVRTSVLKGVEHKRYLREAPAEAIKDSLSHTILLVGKEDTNIVKGKVGNTTSTFYPASGANTPVDGYAAHGVASANWNAKRTSAGTTHDDTTDDTYFVQTQSNATPAWVNMLRSIFGFDTSAIGSDTVDSGTFSVKGTTTDQNDQYNLDLVLDKCSPGSTDQLANSDYNIAGWDGTEQASNRIALNISTSYNNFTLNATGEGNVNTTGLTWFGIRDSADFGVAGEGSEPSIQPGYTSRQTGYFADKDGAGTSSDPKLVVEHSVSSVAYTTSVADGLTLGDVLSHTFNAKLTQTDSVSLSDSSSFVSTFTRTISEALSLSDTISAAILIPISVTEAITLSDTKALVSTFTKTISDTFSLSDSIALIKGLSATISESISLSDSATVASIIALTVSESITLVDSIIKGGWSWITKATDTTWNFINKNQP